MSKPDLWNEYFFEKHGTPPGWRWASVDISESAAPDGFVKVEGAVCPTLPNGALDWSKRDRTTERTFFFVLADLRAYELARAVQAGASELQGRAS